MPDFEITGPLLQSDPIGIAMAVVAAQLDSAGVYLMGEVAKRTPIGATSAARGSVLSTGVEFDSDGNAAVTLYSMSEYMEALDYGSKPHMPPVAPIEMWVQRSGPGQAIMESMLAKIPQPIGRRTKQARLDRQQRALEMAVEAVRFGIFHHGTSVGAKNSGIGRTGPTGGIGYFMFERALEENVAKLNANWFEPIGLTIAQRLS